MSVARAYIPANIAVFLSAHLQEQIVSASHRAEQRIATREQAAEQAACALQWINTELDVHVRRCTECRWRACRSLRAMRRASARADRSYQRALKRLTGGR